VSSRSTFRLLFSGSAKKTLEDLRNRDPERCRRLTLLVLSLEKDPTPEGSRELVPEGEDPLPGARVWSYGELWVAYRVDPSTRTIDIGLIEIR